MSIVFSCHKRLQDLIQVRVRGAHCRMQVVIPARGLQLSVLELPGGSEGSPPLGCCESLPVIQSSQSWT